MLTPLLPSSSPLRLINVSRSPTGSPFPWRQAPHRSKRQPYLKLAVSSAHFLRRHICYSGNLLRFCVSATVLIIERRLFQERKWNIGERGKRRIGRPDYVGDDVGQTLSGTNRRRQGRLWIFSSPCLLSKCVRVIEFERGGGFKLSHWHSHMYMRFLDLNTFLLFYSTGDLSYGSGIILFQMNHLKSV